MHKTGVFFKYFFSYCDEFADLLTFTKEISKEKPCFCKLLLKLSNWIFLSQRAAPQTLTLTNITIFIDDFEQVNYCKENNCQARVYKITILYGIENMLKIPNICYLFFASCSLKKQDKFKCRNFLQLMIPI